jgi:glycosyltransferase involved in cell wall biosynthesis
VAAVTVGVPVFNAGALLEECLACLAGQTFADIRVIVSDNASTDRTPAIAEEWARRDPRFELVRQGKNVGPTLNFIATLNAADSEYFMWRAYDDLSSPNYIEVLHRLLSEAKHASLAVGAVRSQRLARDREKYRPVPDLLSGSHVARIDRVIAGSHPSWYYGLWRRPDLAEIFLPLAKYYPSDWGADHLTLLGPILDDRIVGSEDAVFIQRIMPEAKIWPAFYKDASAIWNIRRDFISECRRMVARRDFRFGERMRLRRIIAAHANGRIATPGRIARIWLNGLFSR